MKQILGLLVITGCAVDRTPEPPVAPAVPSTLFVADYGADAILRYDAVTGAFAGVFAAGRAQRVDRPASVRLGPGGQLYSAGFGQADIVRYDAVTGAMADVFYRDTTLIEEPVELAFHGDDLIVVGNDTGNAVVIDASGTATRELGWPLMRGAHDFVLDGDTLFVGVDSHESMGTAIQAWDLPTGTLLRTFGGRGELATATGLVLVDGVLLACDFHRNTVLAFEAATGDSLGALVTEHLTGPVSLERGPDGSLLVLDRMGVQRFDATSGAFLGTLVAAGDGHLDWPRGLTIISDAALRAR